MALKLNVGKVAFPIEFDNGDKDVIYFNPNDPDLATRLMKAQETIDERIKKIEEKDFELMNDGSAKIENIEDVSNLSDEERADVMKKAENISNIMSETKKIMSEELNKAFDSDISSVVFKHCSPFAIVNGEYYIIQFLNAIAPEIKKHISTASAEMQKKMSKHISKYQVKR